MICQEYRPQTFSQVAGQTLIKDMLKAVVKNPINAPKTLIMQGEYGTGKTTCARILSKALNCLNSKNGDACGECEFCKQNIDNSIFYEEFDSAMIGNVETIKSLRDTFYFDKSLGWKVIVLDEAQLMTPQAQSALLKVLEDSISGIFFVMCTTNIDKILPTIRSRSLKLKFDLVKESDIIQNLNTIFENKQLEKDEDVISLIARRSNGHLRDAHILLDQYLLLGKESFMNSIRSSEDLYYKLILNAFKHDINTCSTIINAMLNFPLSQLKQDFELIILNLIKGSINKNVNNKYLKLILTYKSHNLFQLIELINNETYYSMFTSDKLFQAAMFMIVKNIIILYS